LKIKGFQKSSFIDYPDKISAVIFTGGCNFRCPYCHNSELVYNKSDSLESEEILDYLKKRKKYLDGVCISGGEPTLQKDLAGFIEKLKALDYLVKLDTNGTSPETVKELLDKSLIDYVAMDIKAPFSKYRSVVIEKTDIDKIKETVEILKNSAIDYEFRTTICKELVTAKDILTIAKDLRGSKRYTLQNYRYSDNTLSSIKYTPYKREELELVVEEIKGYFDKFQIRY
jgi:pyruvate formate lyase activating enzyme